MKLSQEIEAKKIASAVTKSIKLVIGILVIVAFLLGISIMLFELVVWGFSVHPFAGGFTLAFVGSFLFAAFNVIKESEGA